MPHRQNCLCEMAGRLRFTDPYASQRRQEEQREFFVGKVKQEQTERRVAEWETTSHVKGQQQQRRRAADQMTAGRQAALEARRDRLAALLVREEGEYFKALEATVDTQDQRRARLVIAALAHSDDREIRRQELAQTKLDQAFRENCVPLREAVSRLTVHQVTADRDRQLEWQEERRRELAEDNRIFDELWEQERLKQVQRAESEMERTRHMTQQLRTQLEAQQEEYRTMKAREAALEAEEDRVRREQAELEARRETEAERERLAKAAATRQASREVNESLKLRKVEEERRARHEALVELQAALESVKFDAERALKAKVTRRSEAATYLEALRQQVAREAEDEAAVDRLWGAEAEKEWAKREATWRKEQTARDVLLRDVMEERARQLTQKRAELKASRRDLGQERDGLLKTMEAATRVDADLARARREAMMQARRELEQQIQEKIARQNDAKREAELEKAAQAQAEREYRQRVQKELDVVEAKRPERFRAARQSTRPF